MSDLYKIMKVEDNFLTCLVANRDGAKALATAMKKKRAKARANILKMDE